MSPSILSLPGELRNAIYEYILEDHDDVVDLSTFRIPPLAQTCHQLRNEILPYAVWKLKSSDWTVALSGRNSANMAFLRAKIRALEAVACKVVKANRLSFIVGDDTVPKSLEDFEYRTRTGSQSVRFNMSRYTWNARIVASQEHDTILEVKEQTGRLHQGLFCTRRALDVGTWYNSLDEITKAMEKMTNTRSQQDFDGFSLTDVRSILGAYVDDNIRSSPVHDCLGFLRLMHIEIRPVYPRDHRSKTLMLYEPHCMF